MKRGGVPASALAWWLAAVGAVRLAFAWSCLFGPAALCSSIFSQTQMTGVQGRTFGAWTLLSCTLCFLSALNLGFAYGLAYLAAECLVHHTVSLASPATFTFISVTSMAWMLLQWNSHGHGAAAPSPCA